jgi:hypothetical protein
LFCIETRNDKYVLWNHRESKMKLISSLIIITMSLKQLDGRLATTIY